MLPVLIGSHPGSPWLTECVESIRSTTDRQIVVHEVGGYEPAALLTGCNLFDRFLFLQDSTRILSETFWEHADATTEGSWLTGWPPMFMGIHVTDQLRPHLPTTRVTKQEAINLEARLPDLLDYNTIWPTITDHTALRREHKHGRDNLILGVEGVWEKWKGTWV